MIGLTTYQLVQDFFHQQYDSLALPLLITGGYAYVYIEGMKNICG